VAMPKKPIEIPAAAMSRFIIDSSNGFRLN
jgi:hypothetical protein